MVGKENWMNLLVVVCLHGKNDVCFSISILVLWGYIDGIIGCDVDEVNLLGTHFSNDEKIWKYPWRYKYCKPWFLIIVVVTATGTGSIPKHPSMYILKQHVPEENYPPSPVPLTNPRSWDVFCGSFSGLEMLIFDRQRKAGEKHLYRELEIWEGKTYSKL